MSILEAALDYARRGIFVFPCGRDDGKKPLIPEWQIESSIDETVIQNWWDRWPKANVGIDCGKNKLLVLDIDPKKGGMESYKALRSRIALPEPTVITGTDGLHIYMRCDDPRSHNTQSSIGPGIDTRGRGGLVVGVPSLNPISGKYYRWYKGDRPTGIKPAPEALLRLLQEDKRTRTDVPAQSGPVLEGGRNAYLASLAGSMRRRGSSQYTILAALNEANREQCVPPLDDSEVQTIARSICRYRPEEIDLQKLAAQYLKYNKPNGKSKPLITQLSTVQPEEVDWLVKPWIPCKKNTLLEGDPNCGKTWIALQIAASVTTGKATLDDPTTREPGNVVFFLSEDGMADTIRPRFDLCGGDATKFFVVTGQETDGKEGGITLADVDTIMQVMEEVKPRLVVLDPVQSFLGSKTDANRANEVRPLLNNLMKVMEKFNCACIIVRHLRKGAGKDIQGGLGSIDFFAQVRSVLRTEIDPETKVRKLKQIKNNLHEAAFDLTYELRNGVQFHSADSFVQLPSDDDELSLGLV